MYAIVMWRPLAHNHHGRWPAPSKRTTPWRPLARNHHGRWPAPSKRTTRWRPLADSNHLFHRVCIYNSCTSPLAYRFNCPTCRKPLLKDDKTNIRVCNDLLNKIKLTDEEIKQYGRTGGGRSRSRSRTRKISGGYGKRKLSSYTKKKKINKRIKKSKTRRVKK